MGKYKQLIKNMGLLTIGSMASKMLSFLLIPLYTNILTTGEYGEFDVIITTISLLLPILSLNIVEAVLRFGIGKEHDKEYLTDVFSVGLKYSLYGIVLLSLFLLMNHFSRIIPLVLKYEQYMMLLFFAQSLSQLLMYFARSLNRMKDVSICGIISSVVMLGLNILFLVYLKIGVIGYFWACIISNFVAVLYYIVRLDALSYIRLNIKNEALKKEMLLYSIPMIFNTVGWWVNNSSDRYIVTWFCGAAINGVYAVAYKIPSILNIFHSIFTQAWTISAVQEYKSEDKSLFFKNVYNVYGGLMTIICSILIVLNKPISHVLFQKAFFSAWVYTPWLLIAVIFGTLSGVLGGVFSAEKDSRMFAISTCIGAGINIVLNIILVKYIGAIGAAIATTISGYVVWVLRIRHIKRYFNMGLNLKRDHFIYAILVLQGVLVYLISNTILYIIVSSILLFLIVFLYRNEILVVIRRLYF